jgi:hypothetical protein
MRQRKRQSQGMACSFTAASLRRNPEDSEKQEEVSLRTAAKSETWQQEAKTRRQRRDGKRTHLAVEPVQRIAKSPADQAVYGKEARRARCERREASDDLRTEAMKQCADSRRCRSRSI